MRVVWEGEAGNEGLGESRKDGTEKRLRQATVDLSDCANHVGEGGEDLDGPRPGANAVRLVVKEYPVHVWQNNGRHLKKNIKILIRLGQRKSQCQCFTKGDVY